MGQITSLFETKFQSTLDLKIQSLLRHGELQYLQRCELEAEFYWSEYPDKTSDDLGKDKNYLFYTNKAKCRPDDCYIDEILNEWFGDYDRIENSPGVVHWLFPTRETDSKRKAQALQIHEAQKIQRDPEAMKRVVKSYLLMLDFFGIELKDETTGEVGRAENWKERFENLNDSIKRVYLWSNITRMLTSMGELGLEKYKKPLLAFICREALCKNTLTNTIPTLRYCWIANFRDRNKRNLMRTYAEYLAANPVTGLQLDLNAKWEQRRRRWADDDDSGISDNEES